MPVCYQLFHIAVEKCKQNCPYMCAVLVSVGKNYNFIIFQCAYIEVFIYAGAQSGNDCTELFIFQHLIQLLFLCIQRLTSKGQDSLKSSISALLGTAARRVTLNNK